MLKNLFLRRRTPTALNVAWDEHAAPGVIRSLGLHPLVLLLLCLVFGFILLIFGGFLALSPIGGTIIFVALLLLLGFFKMFAGIAPGAPWWMRGLFFSISSLLVLNVGFGSMFFGPASAPLPLTDLALAVALLASAGHVLFYQKKIRLPLGMWGFFVWVVFNLAVHLPFDFQDYGMSAARDAIRILEMLYIIPAYVAISLALSSGTKGQRWIKSFMYGTAIVVGLYGLFTPIQGMVAAISPAFPGVQKNEAIFGNYQTWPMAGLMGIFSVLLWRWAFPGKMTGWQKWWATVIVASGLLAFAVLQSRAGYVFFALSMGVMLFIGGQGRQVRIMMAFIALCCAGLLAVELSGVELKGRVGKLSLTGVVDHVLTLTGESKNSEFHGAAGGISQRKAWRAYSLGLWSESINSRIVGIGFGRMLTDMTRRGDNGELVGVQDPHNSFVTALTRSGLVGLAVMLVVFVWVFYMAIVGYRRMRERNRPVAAYFLGVLLFHVYCMVNAWGEPHYEVAHYLIPSFFIYGATWAVWDKFVREAGKKKPELRGGFDLIKEQ